MIQESNKRHCKICGQLRTRIEDGKFPNTKNKRYKDEEGKLWNGKTAPCCHGIKVKEGMKKLRFIRTLEKEDDERIKNGII